MKTLMLVLVSAIIFVTQQEVTAQEEPLQTTTGEPLQTTTGEPLQTTTGEPLQTTTTATEDLTTPATGQKCADNMVYMAVCNNWKELCNGSEWMRANCEKTCEVCKPINCTWDEYSDWTTCTKTCDGGVQVRQRQVAVPAQFGGEACNGGAAEQRVCNPQECPTSCLMGDYGEWGPCSEECGGGTHTRTRKVIQPAANGGHPCEDYTLTETRSCNVHDCAVNCEFGEWRNWTTCDRPCAGGEQYRTRVVLTYAENGGELCQGDAKELQVCNSQPCPVDCEWNTWHEWEQCSQTCGGGLSSRTRNVKQYAQLGGRPCNGTAFETKDCNNQECPTKCEWNPWGDWGECSKTCDGGRQERSREIGVYETNGGEPCDGNPLQSRSCNIRPCPRPCIWEEFGHWDSCSKSCGGGQQSRTRGIRQRSAYGGEECTGNSTETRECNVAECLAKVDCVWGPYGDWSACSKSCGGGFQTRLRDVEQQAQNGGLKCGGASSDLKVCNEHQCPIDCRWGSYGIWSECTESCGGGTRFTTRKIEREAEHGGLPCVGGEVRTVACNKDSCPVDCEWGEFGEWGGCSQTCGEGIQTRTRRMTQFAKFGGILCSGYSTESRPCNLEACPADCEWSDYSVWSQCSKTCGGGEQARARYIQRPEVNGGKECTGEAEEVRNCAKDHCPVACKWNDFGSWSACSQDCGGGWQRRARTVQQEAAYGGLQCDGCAAETRACNTHNCPRNCKWAPYSEWSDCSKSCDGGNQNRTRVLQQTSLNGGMDCVGEATQFRDCNMQGCPVDCVWDDWSQWDLCTKTCGGGMQGKTRRILTPERNGGERCVGDPVEMQNCNMQPCQICKDSPRYAEFCPGWSAYCANSAFVQGCCRKSCHLC